METSSLPTGYTCATHLDYREAGGMDNLCAVGTFHQSEGGVAGLLLIRLLADLTHCRERKARLEGTQGVTKQTRLQCGMKRDASLLTERHCRSTQVCLSFPGPPNFFMSLQKLHSPHSGLMQASQRLHLHRGDRSATHTCTGGTAQPHLHRRFFYLTLRRLRTDMEEAGFCGRGMMGVEASLGRGGGGGGGGGWYHEGWGRNRSSQVSETRLHKQDMNVLRVSGRGLTLFGHLMIGFPV